MSPSERRRKLFMHINVTIGLLGFLGAGARAVQGYVHASVPRSCAGLDRAGFADYDGRLLLIYVILCVRSFMAARRPGRSNAWAQCAVEGWVWACAPSACRTRRGARDGRADPPKTQTRLKKLWPQIWRLVGAAQGSAGAGLALMAINRVAGLVLPWSRSRCWTRCFRRFIRSRRCCRASL